MFLCPIYIAIRHNYLGRVRRSFFHIVRGKEMTEKMHECESNEQIIFASDPWMSLLLLCMFLFLLFGSLQETHDMENHLIRREISRLFCSNRIPERDGRSIYCLLCRFITFILHEESPESIKPSKPYWKTSHVCVELGYCVSFSASSMDSFPPLDLFERENSGCMHTDWTIEWKSSPFFQQLYVNPRDVTQRVQ